MSNRALNVRSWVPMMYVTFYGMLKEVAMKYGYALAVHGSITYDLDIIAVPWVEKPGDVIAMLHEFRKIIGEVEREDGLPYDSIGQKPHGRVAYTMGIGCGGYLDISVVPTITSQESECK